MDRRQLLMLGLTLLGFAGTIHAQEKPDPTGTWKWTVTFNDQKRDMTLTLKLDGNKLVGTLIGRDNQETPIENGMFKDGELSFTVTRDRNGGKVVSDYSGKLDGDKIKGTIEISRSGETQSQTREWEATRVKP